MKIFLVCFAIVITTNCSTSKKILYSFESKNVTDSIIFILQKHERQYHSAYQKIKWFAMIRESFGSYEMIINGDNIKKSLFYEIVKKSRRFIKINDDFLIPVVFESDILSSEMRKFNAGSINFGGYYFEIVKENGEYKVAKTGVLF